MPSKSSAAHFKLNNSWLQEPWIQSVLLHVFVIGALSIVVLITSKLQPAKPLKFTVIEKEVLDLTKPSTPEKVIDITQKLPEKVIEPRKRVFGLNKEALQNESAQAVEVKAGNTIAKEQDNEKLDPNDAGPLPIPADEYLVTAMPKLKSEMRIAYPADARAKKIEGAVVMEILIDEKGKVRKARVLEGPSELTQAALKAIYSFEFQPALVDSKPVAVQIRYSYRFVLN
ncbi:MAG: TonB family protein [Pseudobdellovibrionaceae bacterium]